MPPRQRWSTDRVKSAFSQFGFELPDNYVYSPATRRQTIRAYNEVHNRYEDITLEQFLRRRDKNRKRLVEVDPFLHAISVHRPAEDPTLSRLRNYVNRFPLPEFADESNHVKQLTMNKARQLKQQTGRRRDVRIDRTDDPDEDKSGIYAILDTIYSVSEQVLRRHYVALKVTYQHQLPGGDFAAYYPINDNTRASIENLIKHLYFGEQLQELTDSDTYMLYALHEWSSIEIVFRRLTDKEKALNRLDNPAQLNPAAVDELLDGIDGNQAPVQRGRRIAGSKWKWLNTTDIDLTRFGIFSTFEPSNYHYSCFVWALEHSGVLTNDEIEYVKSIINVKHFPHDEVKNIVAKLGVNINVYHYKDDGSHDTYEHNFDGSTRTINLLLRKNHYMLNETLPIHRQYLYHMEEINRSTKLNPSKSKYAVRRVNNMGYPTYDEKNANISINELITIFFKLGYFKPLKQSQLAQTLFTKKDLDYTDLSYPDICVKPKTVNIPDPSGKHIVYCTDISNEIANEQNITIKRYKGTIRFAETDTTYYKNASLFFRNPDSIDVASAIIELKNALRSYDIDLDVHKSCAEIGQAILYKHGCFDGVYDVSGKIAKFVAKCAPKIVCGPAYNKPVSSTGNFTVIDKNGSYTSVYRDFAGIPIGKPKVITDWNDTRSTADYYYVLLNVKSFKCKHNNDPFPMITKTGPFYCDKQYLTALLNHYDIDYDFVSGLYYNEGFNTKIRDITSRLYATRQELKQNGSVIEQCFKAILSSIWGKNTHKQLNTYTVYRSTSDADKFRHVNHDFIYYERQVNDNTIMFVMMQSLSPDYACPQFSTNVLSFSRSFMNDLYYRAADLGYPVYYSNTDCLLMDTEHAHALGVIGNALGEYKVEYENITNIIIMKPKTFLWQFADGSIRVVSSKRFESNANAIKYFNTMYNNTQRQ